MEPQAFSVKRAQVEFHNFACLGEPERAIAAYADENARRGSLIRKHLQFIGPMTPFLEIGANVGHTSYMLCNEFGADGFALDISADALRFGVELQDRWNLSRAPIRIAGDGAKLPFRDGSLRMVMTYQTLSQFMDLEQIFVEVKRVLAPGGIFLFAEEPIRRLASLHLYRCPYYREMSRWERKLYDWGLLGYIAQDVIGAHQEESFGIRQNHRLYLPDWDALIGRHFAAREYDLFVPERGWGERIAKNLAIRLDPYRSTWRAARLLGGTLAAICRKAGEPRIPEFFPEAFEAHLRCPDCQGDLLRDAASGTLQCLNCRYEAALSAGVYNLLPSSDRRELYPGDRDDLMDCSLPGHAEHLGTGWYEVEGTFGNRYRWIAGRAVATLRPVNPGLKRLRIRGFAPEPAFRQGSSVKVEAHVNGKRAGEWTIQRTGLFVLEADVPDAQEYTVEILASPEWQAPGDARTLAVNLSLLRLIPRD